MGEHQIEILLVEDDVDAAELTLLALSDNKVSNRIQWVRDGAEALEFVFAQGRYADRSMDDQPLVVLLDLNLPIIDGHEVLRQIRADPRTSTMPVVVLTSSVHERDRLQAYKKGVNSYIVKPVDFIKFSETIVAIGKYWVFLNEPLPAVREGPT